MPASDMPSRRAALMRSVRHGAKELQKQEYAENRDEERGAESKIAIEHAKLVEPDIERQCGGMDRHQQAEHDHHHHGTLAAKFQFCHGIGARNCDHDLKDQNECADNHAVEQQKPHRHAAHCLGEIIP
ncbi:hypothetical protein MKL73_10630 [Brucella abortus]|uniref:Uncharacterized protein n=1 Tax=Brucella abortus TaxID=235 RepID=A0AAE9LF37_BRUAO|nr:MULTISPECIES: hypothetical protein [Brucella]MCH1756104.1 hypothetical protein [Brucella abortus]MCH1763553.1 hypothetical protein [Brucella abortus]MCH1766233.1 hypothetical protein [Brucella abortus]MCH1769031.1 hypothetical protein [Brucella abortus]MDL4810948.1 hypothetical protein [Brucella abortus]